MLCRDPVKRLNAPSQGDLRAWLIAEMGPDREL